jgi:2-(3-amino-3-carboxypropyl)histidine synthase
VNAVYPRFAYDDQVWFPVPVLSPQKFEISVGIWRWDESAIDEI